MSSLVIPAVSFLSYHAEQEQKLICRRQKALRLCKIIHYMQHCYDTVRFKMYVRKYVGYVGYYLHI